MLDIKFIRDNMELVKKAIKDKNVNLDMDKFIEVDIERRKLLTEVERLKCEKNEVSSKIGKLMKEKKNAKDIIASMKTLSQKIADLDDKVEEKDNIFKNFIYGIPNIPDKSVPIGAGPEANKLVKEWGKLPKIAFKAKTHLELGKNLGLFDFGRATKMSGSGFVLFSDVGARLQRALINFMLDMHTKKHGYKEVSPPFLVNRRSMIGTGQLPKLEVDMYRVADEDLFLIPTAEVPVTNIHAGEVLEEEMLPINYTAYTACFRKEAGSYGKDTKGLMRVHQFDKVELVKFVKPETSSNELEKLLKDAEVIIQALELPYRIVALSTGDLSFAASKCYDIELWAHASKKWLEVSSCSTFMDFQARRANIKFRSKDSKKTQYVHTLNGSGVALPRLIIALLENYQNKDGSVNIPKALRPYMNKAKVIKVQT